MKLNEKTHTLGNKAEWKNTNTRKWNWMKKNTLGKEAEWKTHKEMNEAESKNAHKEMKLNEKKHTRKWSWMKKKTH